MAHATVSSNLSTPLSFMLQSVCALLATRTDTDLLRLRRSIETRGEENYTITKRDTVFGFEEEMLESKERASMLESHSVGHCQIGE